MTDNRTTEQTAMERFRMLLEKRGIEYETNDDECAEGEERTTVFESNLGDDIFVTVKDWYCGGELTPWLNVEFHSALTPEQAIAATLGNDAKPCYATDYTHWRCKYSVNRGWTGDTKFYVPTVRHGTLTAEQVMAIAGRHQPDYCSDTHVCFDWQAIADELNARAERACEPKWTLQGKTQTQEFWRCECGNCGHEFGVEDRSSFPFKTTIDKVEIPNFCSNCGRRIERGDA